MAIIYKATNIINGKSYIGVTTNFENRKIAHKNSAIREDGYYFHRAIAKHGWDAFEWSIIVTSDDMQELLIEEQNLIEKLGTHYLRNGYNLTLGGEGHLGHVHSPETRQKISEKAKARPMTEARLEVLRKNAQGMKGRGHTEEMKEHLRAVNTGKKRSPETCRRIGLSTKKKTFFKDPEYREKMRVACTGKKRTPEQKENYRQAALNRTPEHKEAIRLAKLAKKEISE